MTRNPQITLINADEMNQNLTQREWLHRAAGETPALPGRAALDGEPLVQTSDSTRERLAREILEVSGPMRRPDRHRHWLLSLEVDVLKQRLEILVKEKDKA